jgi:RimJ/RimL family protein N-acetyltransferase
MAIYDAVQASREELNRWLSWPDRLATPELAETEMRRAAGNFIFRTHFLFLMYAKTDGRLVGAMTVHHIDWSIPNCEMGYWLHTGETGKGYMVEAVRALTYYCFTHLHMVRVEILCDTRNQASARVAQRAGYTLESHVKNIYRDNDGNLTESERYFMLPPSFA